MKTPILGSAYVARNLSVADNRMVNLFPEIVPEGGKEPAFLNRAPGLKYRFDVGNVPVRGMMVVGDALYVVGGPQLRKVTVNSSGAYVTSLLGTVSGTGPVSMANNGTQLFVACNGPSYIYNTSTGVFAQITVPNFPGAVTVAYIDGFFVFNQPNSQKIWITSLLDGTAGDYDPVVGDYKSAEGSPDNLVGLIMDHREVWLFGINSVEVWYNSGAADFPLTRIDGAFSEIGCASPYSIAKLDNTVFWLGNDERGRGIVYRSKGYAGERISTHGIEWKIQQYDLSDALAYTYQQDGHSFYVLVIPDADTTWVYDVSTGAWHERAGFVNGAFTRHRGNCHAFFNGENLVGDYENGYIYAFDLDHFHDNSLIEVRPQKWLRSWRALPPGANGLKRTTHHSLQLDCETGVGIVSGQGSNPQVMLRWSDDGGRTWSNEHWATMGPIGTYGQRVIWRRLGMTTKLRDRIYEISGTDPVKIVILGAELLMSQTNA